MGPKCQQFSEEKKQGIKYMVIFDGIPFVVAVKAGMQLIRKEGEVYNRSTLLLNGQICKQCKFRKNTKLCKMSSF